MVTAFLRGAIGKRAKLLFLFASIALLVGADQLAKSWIRNSVSLLGFKLLGFVDVVNVANTGSVFGLLKGTQPFLIELGLTAVIVLLFAYFHFGRWPEKFGAVIAIAGILGNTIDRIARGFVTDFILIGPWPAFNLADAMLCVGVVMLLASMIFQPKQQPRQQELGKNSAKRKKGKKRRFHSTVTKNRKI